MNDCELTAYALLGRFIEHENMYDAVGSDALIVALRAIVDDIEKDPLGFFGKDSQIPKLIEVKRR